MNPDVTFSTKADHGIYFLNHKTLQIKHTQCSISEL